MKLYSCTPHILRQKITEISETIPTESFVSGLAYFGSRHRDIVSVINTIRKDVLSKSDISPSPLEKPSPDGHIVLEHEQYWSFLGFLLDLLKRPDITELEDNTYYEGMEFITRVAQISSDQLQEVFQESEDIDTETPLNELTLDVCRYMMMLYLFFFFEDTTDVPINTEEEQNDDDDDEGGEEDDRGDDDDDDDSDDDNGPDSLGSVRYKESHRARTQKSRYAFA